MYTFSSYVKTENITSEYERSGAYLMVTYQDGSNSTVTAYPDEFLQGTTEGWTRTSLTFTVPSDAASPVCRMHLVLAAEAYGHAWFDGMQLEEGAIANPYNLVENPSFERYDTVGTPESWALSGRGAGDCVTGARGERGRIVIQDARVTAGGEKHQPGNHGRRDGTGHLYLQRLGEGGLGPRDRGSEP